MRLAPLFYALLVRTAFGTLVSLLPLWRLRPAERHVRFQVVLSLVLLAGAAALHGRAVDAAGAGTAGAIERGAVVAVVLAALACLFVNLLYGTFRRRAARALLVCAIVLAAAGVAFTARLAPTADDVGAWLSLGVGACLGGLVVGSVNNAMILGHFYLMVRGLPVEALRRAGRFAAVVVLARLAWFLGVVVLWDGAAETLFERQVIWTSWRIAFGFLGPLALLFLVRDTVRLKNTQAATGLLYVAIGFVLMGELAAVHLELETGIPV